MEFNRSNRIYLLDALRGVAIVYVVLYHVLYDLEGIFNLVIPFFHSVPMEIAHFFFLVVLIGVSGICTGFSRNIFRRGAILYLLGLIITLLTLLFLPENLIVFGILSFMGLIMLLYAAARPVLDRVPWGILLSVWFLLYLIFRDFAASNTVDLFFAQWTVPDSLREAAYLYPLGIRSPGFYSADYFPLLPWGFIFLCGTALSKPILEKRFPSWFYQFRVPVLDAIGRYTLWIYIVHQPVVYGVLWLVSRIF